eukprot:218149-Rhodomonas_salina.1
MCIRDRHWPPGRGGSDLDFADDAEALAASVVHAQQHVLPHTHTAPTQTRHTPRGTACKRAWERARKGAGRVEGRMQAG